MASPGNTTNMSVMCTLFLPTQVDANYQINTLWLPYTLSVAQLALAVPRHMQEDVTFCVN